MSSKTLLSNEEVALANDSFRKTFKQDRLHKIILTASVAHSEHQGKVLTAVRAFTDFKPGSNPYGERDFGAVEVEGTTYYFKIDYLDPDDSDYGKDPREGSVLRILTIMEARDY